MTTIISSNNAAIRPMVQLTMMMMRTCNMHPRAEGDLVLKDLKKPQKAPPPHPAAFSACSPEAKARQLLKDKEWQQPLKEK